MRQVIADAYAAISLKESIEQASDAARGDFSDERIEKLREHLQAALLIASAIESDFAVAADTARTAEYARGDAIWLQAKGISAIAVSAFKQGLKNDH